MADWFVQHWLVSAAGLVLLVLLIEDVFIQKEHAIRHNFPLIGRLRYLLEMVGPELRQYWVANDKEEAPFNRDERRWIYASSKGQNKNFGFGTTEQIYAIGYPLIKHTVFPFPDSRAEHPRGDASAIPCLKVMGAFNGRQRPFRPQSLVNISAMSFGSLGARAITSMSHGAAGAQAYHNTGEGGVSPYHKSGGADIMWQLGTGYFGARDESGRFSLDVLAAEVESFPSIRCIERLRGFRPPVRPCRGRSGRSATGRRPGSWGSAPVARGWPTRAPQSPTRTPRDAG